MNARNPLIYQLILAAVLLPTYAQENYSNYEAWNKQAHIRVGVKKPKEVIKLASKGTLLVLDGIKVVDSINPDGDFLVIQDRSQKGEATRWLQLSAARKRSLLEPEQKRLQAKYGTYQIEIQPTRGRYLTLRLGPIASAAEGERMRQEMVEAGYPEAFLTKNQQKHTYQWVDKNFDKHSLPAQNPALVRQNPNQVIRYEGTPYRGLLRLRDLGNGKTKVINELPLETYLRGVVPSELGPKIFPELEALKAQAVAARTYTLKNMGRYKRKGYDICDTPACQAYEGAKNEHSLSDLAVRETADIVLYHENRLIDALYTSTCGGTTENVENVFSGRVEPYLRARSSYVAEFPRWTLPEKSVDRTRYASIDEQLAVKALLWGMPEIPDLNGNLSGPDLAKIMKHFAWVLGTGAEIPTEASLTYNQFWRILAEFPFYKTAAKHQVNERDLSILLRNYEIEPELASFAGLLIRYDLIHHHQLATFTQTTAISRAFAYRLLIAHCELLGPEPEWQRHRLESLKKNRLKLSRDQTKRTLKLSQYDYYITKQGARWEFIDEPTLEEWDRVYLLQPPFTARILRLKESGGVGSVDRFSAYDSWIEKKTVSELERRVRRYVPRLRGLRDVRILKRSETGRVTLLALDADTGTHKVKGLNIRWSLGCRENLFDLLPGYRNGKLVHLTIIGRGWGHGVGMSQVGAFSLAKLGWDYNRILQYYYTGVEVRPYEKPEKRSK